MAEALSGEIDRLESVFELIERQSPFLKPVSDAFREVFVNRAVLKSRLAERPDIVVPSLEPARLAEGQPWLDEKTIASFMDPWGETARFTMMPLAMAFPSIAADVLKLKEHLEKGDVKLEDCTGAMMEGREEDIIGISSSLGIQPDVLRFILGQMLKPFIEKRTENLRSVIANMEWHRGYCPICGASPELSFLQGEGGQRWLRCSFCGYEWKFDRMTCPYCEKQFQKKEIISISGSEHQWVETCEDCRRYIVCADLRKQPGMGTEAAALGMVHLDIIAQQRGFLPAASCAWNMSLATINR